MKQKQPSKPSRPSGNGKEPATKADVSAVIEYMDGKFGELASRNELKIGVARLEFKIEDAKQETIEHMDKKFAEAFSHLDALCQEVHAMRIEQTAFLQQLGGRKYRNDSIIQGLTSTQMARGQVS